MFRIAFILVLLLSVTLSAAGQEAVPTPQLRAEWKEVTGLRQAIDSIVKNAERRSDLQVNAALQNMLRSHAGHPIVPYVLIALAETHQSKAILRSIEYLQQAAAYPVKTDEWGWASGQQDAITKLAAILEMQERFKEAVEARARWKPTGICGTCAGGNQTRNTFAIYALRLKFDEFDKVKSDMWRQLENGRLYSMGQMLAHYIRALYGREHVEDLREDVKGLIKKYDQKTAKSRDQEAKRSTVYTTLKDVEGQLEFIDTVNAGSLERLVDLLDAFGLRYHGELDRVRLLDVKESAPRLWDQKPWREPLLIRALAKHGDKAIPALIAYHKKTHSPFSLYMIGKLGGNEAIQYLAAKASREENKWNLRNSYFALVLTGSREATAIVKEASASTRHSNVARAAKWALTSKQP